MADGRVLMCDFRSLMIALEPVHQNQKKWVDALYDVWISFGIWTPDSYNFNQKGELARVDVRRDQKSEGILLKRIVPRDRFEAWWVDCTTEIGHTGNTKQAGEIAYFTLCDALNYVDERMKR
jgi:hypothetical protein